MTEEMTLILNVLTDEPEPLEVIARKSGLTIVLASAVLTMLSMRGMAIESPAGSYRKIIT